MTQQTVAPRVIVARATVRQISASEVLEDRLEAVMTASAAWLPKVSDGEPTKILVEAWIAHEGKNSNGLVFRAVDLEGAAAKITAPNLLPMDWNHSAVLPQWDVPAAIGAWYAAEVAVNPEAKGGAGALGIKAKGVVWAWAFPEYAKEMLAMQEARGYVEFSMACLPTSVEMGQDADGPYEVAINPVFLTVAALTVPPGDKDASGSVSLTLTEEQKAALAAELAARLASMHAQHLKEEEMSEKTKEQLASEMADLATKLAEATEKLTAATNELTTLTAELETLKAKNTEYEQTLEAERTKAAEASLKSEALTTELATVASTLETTQKELATAKEAVEGFEAKERAKQVQERWAKRLAELPEAYRAALGNKTEEEQTKFEERWAAASDDAWELFKSDILVAFASSTRKSYLDLSRESSLLPSGNNGKSLGEHARSLLK